MVGSVVVTRRDGMPSSNSGKSMTPYECWWEMSPISWSSNFYSRDNTIFGASGCGAAGTCGDGGACGGSACGGAGCGGDGGGGGCGGGSGCGGGGCGG